MSCTLKQTVGLLAAIFLKISASNRCCSNGLRGVCSRKTRLEIALKQRWFAVFFFLSIWLDFLLLFTFPLFFLQSSYHSPVMAHKTLISLFQQYGS